jgi:putative acetyltransferase
MHAPDIVIRQFQPADAAVVSALNREWLERYALREPEDEAFLADPAGAVLPAGGAIFVAVRGDEIVGTCSMLPIAADVIELLKLAVSIEARGQGVGHRLMEAGLDFARQRAAARVVLVSNHQLESALRLYERFGFQRLPMPADQPFATADIYMELSLAAPDTMRRT